jgi:signal transduction histidine kinase
LSEAGAEGSWVQSRIPEERSEQITRLLRVVGREPFQKRCWAELGFFLASSALAYVAAVTLALFGVIGLLLTVVFVGVLILAGGLRAARGYGGWQRGLSRRVLGEEIVEPERFDPSPGLFRWLRASLTDRTAWRAVGYFVAKVPLTIFGIWFALGIWIEAIFGIASPLTGHSGSTGFGPFSEVFGYRNGGTPLGFTSRVGVFVTGVVFLFIAPWAMRLVVNLDRWLMHTLLGPDAAATRVRSLEQSRSKTLDVATETLQRIERNLHDGTQAQLVALAMRLGQAKDKLDNIEADSGDTADLDAIRRLVDEAHSGAKEAIIDLRDLARGIHPPALDTGLENALATLAARSPVPTEVTVSIEVRPTPAIEAICYFCAAELLANVAQHAQASRASVSCAQHGPWLRIVVRDDGRGGAALNRVGSSSSGLAGLADRVAAVDGNLSIASPPGGPSVVTVDLPAHA